MNNYDSYNLFCVSSTSGTYDIVIRISQELADHQSRPISTHCVKFNGSVTRYNKGALPTPGPQVVRKWTLLSNRKKFRWTKGVVLFRVMDSILYDVTSRNTTPDFAAEKQSFLTLQLKTIFELKLEHFAAF